MSKPGFYFFAFLLAGILNSCNTHRGFTKVVLFTRAPLNSKLYIHNIPFENEKREIVDSATVISNKDSIVMYVPNNIERVYTIDGKDLRLVITFISDSPVIRIHASYFADKYTISSSKASISLKNIKDTQSGEMAKLQKLKVKIDSLKAMHADKSITQPLLSLLYAGLKNSSDQYVNYCDTVSSPAAFMAIYNHIDFADDYKRQKKFILRAVKRFPHYQPLQDYAKDVLATIRIYEEEFMVGDKLPPITLPDVNDKTFSTGSMKGKYYLIDFWSTLCNQCIPFKEAERKVAADAPPGKLQIVSVAIDDEKDEWKKIISDYKYNWIQLIDVKMWQGPAARTLVFDSIPFNFLVNPQGRVIKKAIRPDSLATVISALKLK